MIPQVRITVTLSVGAEGDPHCVEPGDLTDADVTDADLAAALVDVIRRRAERARYKHKPRPELSELRGR